MKTYIASFLGAFIGCVMYGTAMVSAQSTTASPDTTPSMEVRRIGLADLNGVLRAADANVKVRELLDVQRQKFQSEFNKVETELQQTERDLM